MTEPLRQWRRPPPRPGFDCAVSMFGREAVRLALANRQRAHLTPEDEADILERLAGLLSWEFRDELLMYPRARFDAAVELICRRGHEVLGAKGDA